jgi:homoserine/homoserine lactone efflux protein
MNFQFYGLYLTVVSVSMLTPGPAMLQALSLGMRHGPRPVAATALGNVCVTVLQVTAALFGLSHLAACPDLLRAAGLAGAVYIAWLGLTLWRRPGTLAPDTGRDKTANVRALASLFGQGALVASVNPKAWGFLAALLPPFATDGRPATDTVVLLAAPICLLAFGGMMAYASFGSFLGRLLAAPRAMRRIFRTQAVILWLCAGYFAIR